MFSCIIGPNLELRLHEDRYAEEMFDVANASREYLRPWMGWIDKTQSIDDTRKHIRESIEGFANRKCINTGIWENGRFIGSIALHEIHWVRRYAEMGYWIVAAAQGRGIVTRAAAALIKHAFDDLKLHRVEIRCDPDNAPSRAIPTRLGFREEGVLRESLQRADGVMRDMVVYGLLCHEWKNAQAETAKAR